MRPPDAAVPPVAHDDGRRQRRARRCRTGSARCTSCTPTRPRRSSGPRRSSASTSPPAPQREAIAAAMAGVRMGRGLRRHARPADPQRRRRPPRRDAAPLPPARRAARRPGAAAGDLRHRHARRRRQHPDPHRADDRADEVRRHPGAPLHASASSTSSPGGPGGPASTPTATCGCRRPTTSSRTRGRCHGRRRSEGPAQGDARPRRPRASSTTTRRRCSGSSAAQPEPLDVAVPGDRRPRGQRAVATGRPGGAEAPAAHEPRPGAAPPPAPAAGDRGVPQPRSGRRGRAAARRGRPLPRRARRLARRGRGRAQRAALLVAADDVRHRGASPRSTATTRPTSSTSSASSSRCSTIPARSCTPSRTRPRRPRSPGSRPRACRTRSAWSCSSRSRGRSRWPSCSTPAFDDVPRSTTRGSPTDPSPKSILREMLESGDTLRHVRAPLPARAQRGSGAALPHRRVAHARPLAARRRLHRRVGGRRRVARRADPGHRRDAARRVDAARRPARSTITSRPTRPDARIGRGRRRRGGPPCAPRRSAGSSCWPTRSLRDAGRAQRVDRGAARPRRWRRTGPSTTRIGIDADARSAAAVHARRGARPLGRHAAPRRPGRRRRVALRRRRRPRDWRGPRAPRRCSSSQLGRVLNGSRARMVPMSERQWNELRAYLGPRPGARLVPRRGRDGLVLRPGWRVPAHDLRAGRPHRAVRRRSRHRDDVRRRRGAGRAGADVRAQPPRLLRGVPQASSTATCTSTPPSWPSTNGSWPPRTPRSTPTECTRMRTLAGLIETARRGLGQPGNVDGAIRGVRPVAGELRRRGPLTRWCAGHRDLGRRERRHRTRDRWAR